MVPLGKPILPPPSQDPPESPKVRDPEGGSGCGGVGGDEFPDNVENFRVTCKSADMGKAKRGITSFFRNILRRGKDSTESLDQINPDITLMKPGEARPESRQISASTPALPGSAGESVDDSTSSPDRRNSKFSPQPRFKVLPTAGGGTSSPTPSTDQASGSSSDAKVDSSDGSGDGVHNPPIAPKPTLPGPSASPPPVQKSKGLPSPKMLIKRDRSKKGMASNVQPPSQPPPPQPTASKEDSGNSAGKVSSSTSTPSKKAHGSKGSRGDPDMVRRRAKSPKRAPPPVPPVRTSMGAKVGDAHNPSFKSELERRLSRAADGSPSSRGAPPSPTSPVPEVNETVSEPVSPTEKSFPEESSRRFEEETRVVEKIELPTAAPNSRKSFLGKLSASRKSRAPAPPSVKRAKSITETTLPRDKRSKKINPADISGPVLVTDMTNTKIPENRRNTITLGEESAFASGGSVSSSSGTDRSFEDLPTISPLGSLENLYEAILPKIIDKYNAGGKTLCPNIPAEGYLEPVPPSTAMSSSMTSSLTSSMASSMTSSLMSSSLMSSSMTSSQMSSSTLMSSSVCSSIPASMTSSVETINTLVSCDSTSTMTMTQSLIEEDGAIPEDFEEMDISEERRQLLANQPIYEEIPNGYSRFDGPPSGNNGDKEIEEDARSISTTSQMSHSQDSEDSTKRSHSKETVSSESDTQSACGTLSRPRPAPRRKARKSDTVEQYVAMNRPGTALQITEDKLRDTFSRMTHLNLQILQDVYAQVDRILGTERLEVPTSTYGLRWSDFDIYGQPLHASERCVVYNTKLKANNAPCQICILHSRPATEMSATLHPSLLKPVSVFADAVPFSFLPEEFVKTSQLLQNSVYEASQARCFVAVGSFHVVETLESHLGLLRETLDSNLDAYLRVVLLVALQLLSAVSHCLDQGYTVTETDFRRDVFLLARPDLRGKVVAFLPHQRSHDVLQGEATCNFLHHLLEDALGDSRDVQPEHPAVGTVQRIQSLLEPRRIECLARVRSVSEFLLWGPGRGDLAGILDADVDEGGTGLEQDLSLWLEKERATAVGKFAKSLDGVANGVSLDDYYRLKFLLKSSAASLCESYRILQ